MDILRLTTLFLVLIGLCEFEPLRAQNTHLDSLNGHYAPQLTRISKEFKTAGFDLDTLFKDKRFEIYGSIDHKFTHSAEHKIPTLDEYKALLHFDEKIVRGMQFIKNHKKRLKKAEKKYGISRYVITAIIGIESDFGKNIGSYNPFNVYVSMMTVDYRADFARAQLKELLKFTRRKKLDIFALKSSYAGAMSYAQFIPYSVNKWWVGDNLFDMNNSIMSVANYLHYFKKRTGSLPRAILRYNTSHLYQGFVLDLADAIQKKVKR